MANGDKFPFTIRATLPNNKYSDFKFTLVIVASIPNCPTLPSGITIPIVSDKTYVVGAPMPSSAFTVPDFTVASSPCILHYSNSVNSTESFINFNDDGKTFNWYTSDKTKIG